MARLSAEEKKAAAKQALLHKVATDTKSETGYSLVKAADEHVKELASEGKIALHPDGPNTDGFIAAKLIGDAPPAPVAATPTPKAEVPAPTGPVELEHVYLKPAPAKPLAMGERYAKWPFFTMEVGQSFVVPASAEVPDPAKKFVPVVAAVLRKLLVNDPSGATVPGRNGKPPVPKRVPSKTFTIRAITAGEKYPDGYEEKTTGARIYRTS